MLKDTSKESDFHADLNIKVSSNLVFIIKSYEPEKICLILENRGKNPLEVIESQRKLRHRIWCIRELYSKNFKLLSTKMWNFVFFARRKIRGAFFFKGSSYRPNGPRMSQEGSF